MKVKLTLPQRIADVAPQSSRRHILLAGALAGVGGALGLTALSRPSSAQDNNADIAILNAAIDLEQQAIWAYTTAAGKLSTSDVGKTVLMVATGNLKDHEQHRDVLAGAVKSLGGTPAPARDSYDLSTYLDAKEGGLDSDANIAKLALALEYDAALAYNDAFSQLSNKDLVAAASTIGPNEVAHATKIRAVFHSLDAQIAVVPSAFVSSDTRDAWILKV
ncbi:MAG: ferritin-like domain-containing protein [Cyanobacteriota bacterium]|nr:ferritin-like domain-containing protein [Cyanobacteriota bacterium]